MLQTTVFDFQVFHEMIMNLKKDKARDTLLKCNYKRHHPNTTHHALLFPEEQKLVVLVMMQVSGKHKISVQGTSS